jgi:hypothetical protein
VTLLHHSRERLAVTAILVVPLLGVLVVTPSSSAQGYDSPTIVVKSVACPDDVAFGDDLFTVCAEPRAAVEITADGPGAASATTDEVGRATLGSLERGRYSLADASIDADSMSLVECHAQEGFGGFLNLAVSYGDAPGTFTVDLTNESAKAGTADICTWYVLPGGSVAGEIAGLAVDAASTTSSNESGVEIVPADGTQTPLSGAGPALPATRDIAYSLSGDNLDQRLVFSVTPDDAEAFTTRASYGPILLRPGDYTLEDRTEGLSGNVTLAAGEVAHAVSVGLAASGASAAPSTAPGAALDFRGRDLDGAYTQLDTTSYGDEAGALYGADSGYATGTLTFDAPDASQGATTISLLGLDDELAASAQMTVMFNGQRLFSGASTFPAWNPSATGNQWGELTFDVKPGVLKTTGNTLTITDTSPGSTVGTPPWVMIVRVTVAQ